MAKTKDTIVVRLGAELKEALEDYRWLYRIKSESEAVRHLLKKSLDHELKPSKDTPHD